MDHKNNRTPQAEIARILVEFLEVAITSVVFLKGVYPNGAFERRRYMNVVVHKARHPQLNEYIHSAVNRLLPFIEKGLVERVAVILFDDDYVPIERFVFKLNVNQSYASMVEKVDLEFSLRSFLIKLPVSEPLTKVLPRNCRWEITAYFRSLPDAEMLIPTDTKQWQQPVAATITDNTDQVHDQRTSRFATVFGTSESLRAKELGMVVSKHSLLERLKKIILFGDESPTKSMRSDFDVFFFGSTST